MKKAGTEILFPSRLPMVWSRYCGQYVVKLVSVRALVPDVN